jgi:hypothetical protein
MANLYYNAAVDTDWSTLGNWWTDSSYSTPASSLPSSNDDVSIDGDLYTISSGEAVVNYVYGGGNVSPRPTMNIELTANLAGFNFNIGSSGVFNILGTNEANYGGLYVALIGESTNYGTINCPSGTFQMQGGSSNNGIINGNCRLLGSINNIAGTIIGNCVFNPPDGNETIVGWNEGSISGVCSFYNSNYNTGNITGNCTFYDSSYNEYPGTITGNVTFNDNSGNGNWDTYNNNTGGGDIVGDVIFNDSSTHIAVSPQEAKITGNITYNDYSYRAYCTTHSNNVVFNDNSSCEGSFFYDIDGNSYNPNVFVIFNDSSKMFGTDSYLPLIMNDTSRIEYSSIGSETSVTLNDSAYITGGASGGFDIPWIFNDNSYITSSANILAYNDPPGNTLTFNHNSYNDGSIEANTVTFNDSSYNNGPITCTTSTFKDSSYNSANGVITGDEIYNDRTPDPIPRGINGSSMLAML